MENSVDPDQQVSQKPAGLDLLCLILCIQETPKQVLLQTVKTHMKCSIMLHFIRVYIVWKGQKDLQTKEYNLFFEKL